MTLVSDDLLRKLERQDPFGPLGPSRELAPEEELVLAKFFTPDANWTWYAVSASKDPVTGDVQFFGLVEGLRTEIGYFWLSELQKVFGTLGLPVELDAYWEPIPLSRLLEDLEHAEAG